MKRYNDEKIRDVIKQMVGEKKFKSSYYKFLIKKFWKEEMSKMVSDSTDSLSIRERKLFINLNSAPIKQELMYHRKTILEKINGYLNDDYLIEIQIR